MIKDFKNDHGYSQVIGDKRIDKAMPGIQIELVQVTQPIFPDVVFRKLDFLDSFASKHVVSQQVKATVDDFQQVGFLS